MISITCFFAPGVNCIGLLGTVIYASIPLSLGDKAVDVCGLLNDDVHTVLTGKSSQDIVADATLSSHIGDKARRVSGSIRGVFPMSGSPLGLALTQDM